MAIGAPSRTAAPEAFAAHRPPWDLAAAGAGLYASRFGTLFPVALLGQAASWALEVAFARSGPAAGAAAAAGVRSAPGLPLWAALLSLAADLLVAAALIAGADDALSRPGGPPLAPTTLVRRGLARLWPFAVATAAVAAAGLLGLGLLVVPGLVVLVWCGLAPAVAVLEGRGARTAIARSCALVRGHFWQAAAVIALGFAGSEVVGWSLAAIGGALLRAAGLDGATLRLPVQAAAYAVGTPYSWCLLVLLYHDLSGPAGAAAPPRAVRA